MQRTDNIAANHKSIGGNVMSLKKSAIRRISLLAGSSILAASLSAITFTGTALVPTTALAYDECTPADAGTMTDGAGGASDPGLNGTTPDRFECLNYFNPEITYTSDGDLTVTSDEVEVGAGINLTGQGGDSVTYLQTGGTYVYTAAPADAVVEVTTQAGNINVDAKLVWDDSGQTQYGVMATSTGGGNISIKAELANISGGTGIQAETNGGDIDVVSGGVYGRLRGILASTSGSGVINITTTGNVAVYEDGLAAIDTVSGTGATRINIISGPVSGGSGAAIRSASASTSETEAVNVQNTGGMVNGRVDFSGVTAGGVTFNNSSTGSWSVSGASVFSGFNDTLGMAGTEPSTMSTGSSIDFGAGNDTWNLSGLLLATDASADFGTGADVFNMSGRLAVNGVLTLVNLETFNNSGVIYLGGTNGTSTNLTANDVFRMTSGTFTGLAGGRVMLDVLPGLGVQEGCASVTLADCLDLRGASTAGVTLLTLNDVNQNGATPGGFNSSITLVDVGGAGTTAPGHFAIDPGTAAYVADYGGAIARPGLFVYTLHYDATNQRHNLVSMPRSPVLEYAMLPGAARSIWQMTTDATLGRQTDLRAGTEGEVWLRATGEYSKRNVATGFEDYGATFTFDDAYKLYAGTILGGMDLVSGTSGGYDYVLGAQLGYVGSSFDLDASDSSGRMTGATGGVYGSFWNSRFFFDGTFNTNFLTLDYDQPSLGSKTNTWLRSVGAQGEAGMRLMMGERLYAEPLADAAFSYTTFEEFSLAGGEIRPNDAQSRRGALGLRVGADYPGQSVNWSYFVTGRAWHEFDGESQVVVKNPGADLVYADDFSGTFSEFEGGLNLSNDSGTVSGFVTSGVKAKGGYSAVDLSTGLRLRW